MVPKGSDVEVHVPRRTDLTERGVRERTVYG